MNRSMTDWKYDMEKKDDDVCPAILFPRRKQFTIINSHPYYKNNLRGTVYVGK